VKSRPLPTLVVLPGVALFLLSVVIPTVALLIRSVGLGATEGESVLGQTRYWVLLGRSLRLAAGGAALSVALSLPGAYVVGRLGRVSAKPMVGALLLAPLLLPPMVYAFGWQRLTPQLLPDELRCVWVWASWCWPIPAMLIGTSWARWGRSAYEAAVLEGSSGRAFFRVVLPLLVRPATLGGLIVLALLIGEYSVPHACNLVVAATSLLGWASQSSRPADVLVPSLPLIILILVALAAAGWVWRRRGQAQVETTEASAATARSAVLVVVMVGVVALTVALPITALAWTLKSWAVMREALTTYRTELASSVAIALTAGLVSVAMGMSLVVSGRWRLPVVIAALALGIVPGALVGEGVLVAYQGVRPVYNNWPLLAIGFTARYGWIGILTAWLAAVSVGRDERAQARTDGAGRTQISLRLGYAPNVALLATGVAIVAAMSLADVAAASLLQVPSVGPISLILIEKFHRFEDGMLISLSLWLVAGAVPAAVLAWAALRGR
jgi:ABC-type Fe3+ transport system permease subunit